jgi:restriction system protein
MPEVTKKRTGEFVRKLFEILLQYPTGHQARDALTQLESQVALTAYEKGNYPGGSRRFEKIVRFATIVLVKAGWLVKNKGTWSITDEGKEAFKKHKDPESFYREGVKLYRAWKASRPGAVPPPTEDAVEDSSVKSVSIAFEEAEEQAWSEISQYLGGMQPYDFQELVASLLRAMDYHVSWIAPPGKDGGIDIHASVDPLGTRPPRIKVQVKRQAQSVDVKGLRSFLAVLSDNDVGLFVSTGGFTKDALDEARTQEKRRVTLIDLEKLFDLWVEYYDKLTDEARKRLPLQSIHFLAPES